MTGAFGLQADRTPRFTELCTIGLDHQRQMRIAWLGQAERTLQQDLPGSAFEEVRTAHDIGHALRGIVNNDGQLIGKYPVAASDYDITERAHRKFAPPLQAIREAHRFCVVDAEAQRA